jgi:hypothetical protein
LQDPKALSYVAPYNVAIVYAGLGNSDQTFAWLDRAYTQRSYYLPVYLTTDARLDWFHGDPAFLTCGGASDCLSNLGRESAARYVLFVGQTGSWS